jgi:hypothetical protein
VAISLLDDLESSAPPAERVLMKTRRLARLMRDTDAQTWLDFETRGYPTDFSFERLGSCERYSAQSGRFNPETLKYFRQSLPELEAATQRLESIVHSFQTEGSPPAIVENYLVKRATEEFIAGQRQTQKSYNDAFQKNKSLVVALRSAIHSYVTDTLLAIEFGDIAQDIFETARNDVDAFVRIHCPKAAEQLIAINERMADGSSESRTAALTTCRRMLMTLADSLFPPREQWTDNKGRKRNVGSDQYKNRLLAFLEEATGSRSSLEITTSGLEHLAARLDAIYEKTCKGVHVEITEQEARLAVIHTYLFVGELARSVVDHRGETERPIAPALVPMK